MNVKTDRLIIKELALSDLDILASLLAHPEVMRFSVNGPLNKEQSAHFLNNRILAHYATHGYGIWGLFLKKEGAFIGISGLIHQKIDDEAFVELGFRLFPEYWGKGYISEANQAIIKYAFEELKIDHVRSIIDSHNTRSLAAAKRVGMHYIKEALFHGAPVHIYEIDRVSK